MNDKNAQINQPEDDLLLKSIYRFQVYGMLELQILKLCNALRVFKVELCISRLVIQFPRIYLR